MLKFQVIDVDEDVVVSSVFDTKQEAEAYAEKMWGKQWWTNETPYAVEEIEVTTY